MDCPPLTSSQSSSYALPLAICLATLHFDLPTPRLIHPMPPCRNGGIPSPV